MRNITAEEVLQLKKPTEGNHFCVLCRGLSVYVTVLFFYKYVIVPFFFAEYLCPLSANKYGIFFSHFKIRDLDTKTDLFVVDVPFDKDMDYAEAYAMMDPDDESVRFIRYELDAKFLKLKKVGTGYVCCRGRTSYV
jgi:GMP-PDE delta subunit